MRFYRTLIKERLTMTKEFRAHFLEIFRDFHLQTPIIYSKTYFKITVQGIIFLTAHFHNNSTNQDFRLRMGYLKALHREQLYKMVNI